MSNDIYISSIEPQKKKKDRYNVYTDGEYRCSLCAESLVVYDIKQGVSVSESIINEAVEADNYRYAFDSAAAILSYGMKTASQLKEKLMNKGIDESAIDKAIIKLEDYGYVNDEKYADDYVRSAVSEARFGRKVIEFKLKQKGLPNEVVSKAIEGYTQEDEQRIAHSRFLILKDKYKGEDKRKAMHKIYSSLMRLGFSYDVINSVLAEETDFE